MQLEMADNLAALRGKPDEVPTAMSVVAGARNSYCSHGLECGFEHEVGHALAEVQDSMQF